MFQRITDKLLDLQGISTHICAGNVSASPAFPFGAIDISTHICAGNVSLGQDTEYIEIQFQLIYVRGMFRCRPGTPAHGHKFQLIYVRGMFRCRPGTPAHGHKFQLIYVRGMFRGDEAVLEVLRQEVSTHICAGNVSRFKRRLPFRAFVSTHICAGNVSIEPTHMRVLPFRFRFIYVRGMFWMVWSQNYDGLGEFQLIYARGMFQHLCVVLPF